MHDTLNKYVIYSFFGIALCFCFDVRGMLSGDENLSADMLDDFDITHPMTRALGNDDQRFCTALEFLCEAINDSVWNKTELPMGRSVLYLLPYKITSLEYGGFAVNLFFNMTDNMGVSANSLLSSDAVNSDDMSYVMTALFDGKDMSPAEVASLMCLFRKVSIQERRVGSLLQAGFIKGPFSVQFNTSFHLAERNFWLDKKDQQEINDILSQQFPGGHVQEQEFLQMRFGMGDSRLKCGLNTLNMTNFQTDVGVESIIPTSRFSYAPHLKIISGQDIDVANAESLKDTLGGVIRGVRDYLINPRLGNNGHFGLGCYIESKADIFKGLAQIWTRLSFDKIFANDEDRLIMFKKTKSKAQIQDAIAAAGVLAAGLPENDPRILNAMAGLRKDAKDFVQQYLFPTLVKTTVSPGGVFNAVFAVSTDIKKMKFTLGYDFYAQQAESIKEIHHSVSMESLRIADVELPRAYQHKVFTEALYVKKFKRSTVGVGLGGDMTVFSKGIGYDWTAYAKLSASF